MCQTSPTLSLPRAQATSGRRLEAYEGTAGASSRQDCFGYCTGCLPSPRPFAPAPSTCPLSVDLGQNQSEGMSGPVMIRPLSSVERARVDRPEGFLEEGVPGVADGKAHGWSKVGCLALSSFTLCCDHIAQDKSPWSPSLWENNAQRGRHHPGRSHRHRGSVGPPTPPRLRWPLPWEPGWLRTSGEWECVCQGLPLGQEEGRSVREGQAGVRRAACERLGQGQGQQPPGLPTGESPAHPAPQAQSLTPRGGVAATPEGTGLLGG